MGTFKVKSSPETKATFRVLKEDSGGFYIHLTEEREYYTEEKEEFIPKTLFDTCIRTGYFTKLN
jgi:hypothetical protein